MSLLRTFPNPTSLGSDKPDEAVKEALKIDWKLKMPQTEATTTVNTDVIFKWSGFHNVYMFPNEADFNNCNFANAKEVAAADQNPFIFKASNLGTYYFGCAVGQGSHCNQPQKLKLTVTGIFYVYVC